MSEENQAGTMPQQQPTQPAPHMGTPHDQSQRIADGAAQAMSQTLPPQAPQFLAVKFEDDLIMKVYPETVNDMRFLELYEEVAESEFKIPKLMKFMFGEDAYNRIYDYYEKKGEKFTITKMGEVFERLDRDLNSNPDFLRQ